MRNIMFLFVLFFFFSVINASATPYSVKDEVESTANCCFDDITADDCISSGEDLTVSISYNNLCLGHHACLGGTEDVSVFNMCVSRYNVDTQALSASWSCAPASTSVNVHYGTLDVNFGALVVDDLYRNGGDDTKPEDYIWVISFDCMVTHYCTTCLETHTLVHHCKTQLYVDETDDRDLSYSTTVTDEEADEGTGLVTYNLTGTILRTGTAWMGTPVVDSHILFGEEDPVLSQTIGVTIVGVFFLIDWGTPVPDPPGAAGLIFNAVSEPDLTNCSLNYSATIHDTVSSKSISGSFDVNMAVNAHWRSVSDGNGGFKWEHSFNPSGFTQ